MKMKMFYLLNYILVILKVSCDQTCRHHKKMEMFPRNPIKQEGEPVIYHYRNIFKKEKVPGCEQCETYLGYSNKGCNYVEGCEDYTCQLYYEKCCCKDPDLVEIK